VSLVLVVVFVLAAAFFHAELHSPYGMVAALVGAGALALPGVDPRVAWRLAASALLTLGWVVVGRVADAYGLGGLSLAAYGVLLFLVIARRTPA
jgi:hypothetical protein